ncbi:hypothetical protein MKEN_01263200 [Mycena kentingensis (nom. inval.)]|nr:hypothetical protein MKEN_01263200 [Mycena kentingensis (nom. inval.)]
MAAQAAKEKEKEPFKAGDYPTAIGHYSAAIIADRSDATFPLNRAAAYLKLGKNEDAERDCSTVLGLDKKNVKALFRRAQARVSMDKLEGAQEDLRLASTLEPTNQSVKQELEKITGMLKQSSAPKWPKPAPGDPKRRRVPITIVEADGKRTLVTPEDAPKPKLAPTAAKSVPEPKDDLMKPVSSRPLTTANGAEPSKPAPAPKPAASSFKDAKTTRDSAKPSLVGGGIFRASGENTIFTPKVKPAEKQAPQATLPKATPASPPVPAPQSAPTAKFESKTPTSLFEFTRAWEETSDQGARLSLLMRIPPSSFPTLFQTSLEPALFIELVNALACVPPSMSKEYMHAFESVPRFGTVTRFLSAPERRRVREVWAGLGIGAEDATTPPYELPAVWGAVYR